MPNAREIRRLFVDYFRKNGHEVVPSSPLVPEGDPTLLFTNAGMVQFKDYFVGKSKPPFGKAVSVQKCLRAGGKHNDLEQVGQTPLHHTFFEMLGNFSFGDYHKAEAIELAWRFITGELALDKSHLYATVHHQDEEAAALWRKIAGLRDELVIKKGDEDNFWSMGKLGPCGPCSELFYRRNEDYDCEIWNLVFMEQELLAGGGTRPLTPAGVDTGMGLERIAAACEGVFDDYETSLFAPITTRIAADLRQPPTSVAAKVIADHLRSAAFLVAEGILPGNEGRAYVLRRIIRRAVRHAWQCGLKKPLLGSLLETLLETFGGQWPELERAEPLIASVLEGEEERFLATISRGMQLLAEKKPQGGALDGGVAFMLYDTYGFPLDLTMDILAEDGIKVDEVGFRRLMEEQKQRGKRAWRGGGEEQPAQLGKALPATNFVGHEKYAAAAKIIALFDLDYRPLTTAEGDCLMVTDSTPFYATSGGQRCDFGTAAGNEVTDVFKTKNGSFVHKVEGGGLKVGERVNLKVDEARRRSLTRHHSATHLLHAALRKVLGLHVTQRGSLVEAERLRFDVSHPKPLSEREVAEVERLVNAQICDNQAVTTKITDREKALKSGAMALFGESYAGKVRIVSMGRAADGEAFSRELCGGTHVGKLGEIGGFIITSQSALGSGVRRVEAVCGSQAVAHWQQLRLGLQTAAKLLKVAANAAEIETRLKSLLQGSGTKANEVKASPPRRRKIAGVNFAWQVAEGAGMPQLKNLVDALKIDNQVAAAFSPLGGKVSFAVGTDSKLDAVALARLVAKTLGGKGAGGRTNLAAGGGTNPKGIKRAVKALEKAISGSRN